MARPKLDDPTVPIAFRMKRSASEWWTDAANDRGTTLPKLLREFGEKVAAFPGGGTQLLDALERGVVEKRCQFGIAGAQFGEQGGAFLAQLFHRQLVELGLELAQDTGAALG